MGKPAFKKSHDGIPRVTRRTEIRLTAEEDQALSQMHANFKESSGDESITIRDYLAILLRRQVQQESFWVEK